MTPPLTTAQLTRIAIALEQHLDELRVGIDATTQDARRGHGNGNVAALTAELDALEPDFHQFVQFHGIAL